MGLSITKTILAILKEVGEGTVKSFFPHPYYHQFCHHHTPRSIYTSLSKLQKKGLIKKTEHIFRLTTQGERAAFWSHLDAELLLTQKKKPKWDGHWRIIFFDIPETKRKHRDFLRQILKTLGFKELQKSIWVTPYKIPEYLKDLLWEERIKHFTRFIIVKEIDYDQDLRKKFELD